MKLFPQSQFIKDEKQPRVEALANYYECVEMILKQKAGLEPKRYPVTPGNNKSSPVSLWMSCADADAILAEAELDNPLFDDD